MRKVRVRFAPSPTGALHVGGVRTALFNYLFARHHNGDFLLRIEDTDQTRYVEGAEEYIIKSLKWCGLNIDEGVGAGGELGPYRQSERKELYRQYALQLVESDNAYYAFDTPEELDNCRKECETKGDTFIYNATTRKGLNNSLNMASGQLEQLLASGTPYVIRFKMPDDENLKLNDIIRGEVNFNTKQLDDKVLFKSDGMPTYHLANVVDDYLMQISHVIRGEEWLPSLPLHMLLYRSFGWLDVMPEFAHLPLILKPVGNGKLSKRDGNKMGFPVFPLEWTDPETGEKWHGYKEDGYFPEAFINMLALLGWNPGSDQEIYSMQELCDAFSLERVHKSGSKFDPEKAKWFNHKYLIEKSNTELAGLLEEVLKANEISYDGSQLEKICGLMKERANFVTDIFNDGNFFFTAPTSYNEKDAKKHWKEETPVLMENLYGILEKIDDFSAPNTEKVVSEWINGQEIGFGKVMNPFRVAVVGAAKGPHMFDITEIIGKTETLNRLKKAMNEMGK
ncbi:glutamate--tRNA ligase [Porphyromonadaceae bacterium OttesenSCG-928-L07]|nr:glutamate--tRNA ligase [Porphyromonadaceae bacterium OttesenSCG-928-L07]MDL2252278.1 glutamate--tRNA ligase [Odoribacter sp. OttesenSCG-928-J03]MDL2330772.1 glutamate--tRNA ligase [Odoribacter sp. OttesenSCG-928-A06]